jgi:hypothetical protein
MIPVLLCAALVSIPTLIMIGARGTEPHAIANETIAAST